MYFWTVRFKKRLVKEILYNYFEKCLAYHYVQYCPKVTTPPIFRNQPLENRYFQKSKYACLTYIFGVNFGYMSQIHHPSPSRCYPWNRSFVLEKFVNALFIVIFEGFGLKKQVVSQAPNACTCLPHTTSLVDQALLLPHISILVFDFGENRLQTF